MAGGAATPIVLSSSFAADFSSFDNRLELDLSTDGTVLLARQTLSPHDRPGEQQTIAQWETHAASYGPRAWFDLRFRDNAPPVRRLVVQDAEYGGVGGLSLIFDFSPQGAKIVQDWSIALSTSLWQSTGSLPWTSPAIRFAEFARGDQPLSAPCTVAGARHAARRLCDIFDERVTSPDSGPLGMAFRSDAIWSLSRQGQPVATSFDGQVGAETFQFGWYSFAQHEPFLWGHAEGQDGVTIAPTFVLGATAGPRLVVAARSGKAASAVARWEAVRAQTPLVARADGLPIFMTYVKATLDPLRIAVADARGNLASSLRAERLFVTEVRLPTADGRLRRTMWGDAETAKTPWIIATIAGRLGVNAPARPESAPASPGAGKGKAGDTKKTSGTPESDAAGDVDDRSEADASIAVGDGSGAPGATIWAVFDRRAGEREFAARRIAFDLALFSADLALPDASRSRMTFGSAAAAQAGADAAKLPYADLRLAFQDGQPMPELTAGEYPRREPASFIWLASPQQQRETARFDLSRAELAASRDRDLINLRFRFFDLVLVLEAEGGPRLQPAHEDCRVIETSVGDVRDGRPVLVVEFDPQHVFEEALFAQFLQLPDTDKGASRETILAKIDSLDGDVKGIMEYKAGIEKEKTTPNNTDFADFVADYKIAAKAARLPAVQQYYVGPFALEPDGMALARSVVRARARKSVVKANAALFTRVGDIIDADHNEATATRALRPLQGSADQQSDAALRNEAVLEQQEPDYKSFRDFYREVMTAAFRPATMPADACAVDPKSPYPFPRPATRRPIDLEFFHPKNRPLWPAGTAPGEVYCTDDPREKRFAEVTADTDRPASYVNALVHAGAPTMDKLAEARLSGPTRLAFRVNCAPPLQASALEAGLDATPRGTPEAPAGGGSRYKAIPFTFEGLTDWSHHEPAVTRRSQKLFQAAPDGLVPPVGSRAANLSDADNLAFQGISRQPVNAEQRLGEIRAALARRPTALETAIELPARLILSTAQDAIWFTRRSLPGEVVAEFKTFRANPPPASGAVSDDRVIESGKTESSRERLWMARLDLEGVDPGLRVVDSPDLRPQALVQLADPSKPKWGQAPPPRGPLAPWFIGPEQMDRTTLTPAEVNAEAGGPAQPDDTLCGPQTPTIWSLLRKLCRRQRDRTEAEGVGATLFRSVLDAYDRHELVLLTSAYGLPVIGKREDKDGKPGALVKDAGQIDPGDVFAVFDADDAQAIQRPQALQASELWLSALGGTLVHDTQFAPSAGALARYGGKIFDGFSIERWREEIVLGRDIVGEVVYKGYLFPFGHKASLVKLTERLFLLSPDFGVKAVLVQRVFLRLGRKSHGYPALGQPFDGRVWCARDVTIKTVQTPDLQDPFASPLQKCSLGAPGCLPETARGGRINLNGKPGFAFWPRVNETEGGLVRFALTIDGATTSAPLIFIDNIGATTGATVEVLVRTYRSFEGWRPRRTLRLDDQKIRYAPETKAGDCSLPTQEILLTASGRSKGLYADWAGFDELFETSPILEGDEQPPFYPALETATVRLAQVERFSGRGRTPVVAQYDGRYARFGFSQKPLAGSTPQGQLPQVGNPLEIFLDLRTALQMGMGSNGDRAGGVAQPNAIVVAVGRTNGPIGSKVVPIYQDQAPATPDALAHGAIYRPKPGDHVPASCAPLSDGDVLITAPDNPAVFPPLHSLADFFDPRASRQGCGTSAATAPLGAAAPAALAAGGSGNEITRTIRDVLKVFFAADAKILGVVTFAELLDVLGFEEVAALADATPILKQTLTFGAGVEKAGENLVEEIHGHLIAPLREIVERFEEQWLAASRQASAVTGTITLARLFPEVGNGLDDLKSKLGLADRDSDPVSLALDLAEVYESARNFGEALLRIASNPTGRLEQAAVGVIQTVLQGFTEPWSQLRAAVTALAEPIEQALANHGALLIAEAGSVVHKQEGKLAKDYALSLPLPDLAAIAAQTGEGLTDPVKTVAKNFKDEITTGLAEAVINTVLTDLFNGPSGGIDADLYALVRQRINDAAGNALSAVDRDVAAARPAIAQAFHDVLEALEAEFEDAAVAALPPAFFAAITQSVDYAKDVVAAFGRLRADIKAADPHGVLQSAAKLASLIFGYRGPAFDRVDDELSKAFGAVKAVIGKTFAANAGDLAIASAACRAYAADKAGQRRPMPQGSFQTPALKDLSALLDALDRTDKNLADAEAYLDGNPPLPAPQRPIREILHDLNSQASVPMTVDWPGAVDELVEVFEKKGAQNLGLMGDASDLFCAYVDAANAASAAAGSLQGTDWSTFDGDLVARLTVYAREIERTLGRIGKDFADIGAIIRAFLANKGLDAATGLLAATIGKLLTIEALDAKYPEIAKELQQRQQKAQVAEAALATALVPVVNVGIAALKEAAGLAGLLSKAASDGLEQVARKTSGLGLDAQISSIGTDIKKIDNLAGQVGSLQDVKSSPASLTALLATLVPGGQPGLTVAKLFAGQVDSWAKGLSDDIAQLAADWAALRTRVIGAPDALQNAAIAALNRSGVTAALAKLYNAAGTGLLALRLKVANELNIPVLTRTASRAVFVAPAYHLFKPELKFDTEEDRAKLSVGDRLAEEGKILADIGQFDPNAAEAPEQRVAFEQFVRSWTAGGTQCAAPLQIADQVGGLAQEVLRGQILALIDIAAIRDALLDAVSHLMPTSTTFSYDFSSAVLHDPDPGSIFLAQKGAVFALSTRIDVDLLKPNVTVNTKGSMGPFAIHLVGDYIDALTLSFGGASFESRNGGAPRFDLSYQSYTVGEALDYVKQLEAYLTPSDGAGFHIGPRDIGIGIQAGYGVNFGALSFGEVSFFNIVFDVTAELPFDNSAAIFRTSLGTKTSPFTISALPYAGSGYFSVYASAGGIIGFEAEFMFGGGGSLTFGILQAQMQVQIGAYFRVMKITVDGRDVSITEAGGTFLAAGSASIWIFHFGTSLYVALASTSSGDMEGEATFTFSFSCGFIHYNYSITAHHTEHAVGSKGASGSASLAPRSQTGFAALPHNLCSSAAELMALAEIVQAPDVTSLAECQSQDWFVYSSYSDLSLVRGAAHG